MEKNKPDPSKQILENFAFLAAASIRRKKADLALIESQNKFIALTENLPGYVAYVNAITLKYEFVNKEYQKSFGIPVEKIIGSHVKDIIGETNFQFAMQYIEIARAGKTTSYENVFNMVSGRRWIKVNYVPDFDAKGNVVSIIVLTYDITEQKLAEQAIKSSKERYEYFISQISDGIYRLEPDKPMPLSLPIEEQIDLFNLPYVVC